MHPLLEELLELLEEEEEDDEEELLELLEDDDEEEELLLEEEEEEELLEAAALLVFPGVLEVTSIGSLAPSNACTVVAAGSVIVNCFPVENTTGDLIPPLIPPF